MKRQKQNYYFIKAKTPDENMYFYKYYDYKGEKTLIIEKKENIVKLTEDDLQLLFLECPTLYNKIRKVFE